ncbi:M56 family metallopeptidase [Sphingomonas qilianensis]|uniref:M56 family metallopeptidase n=1 Tax=Sphingomonas qilianensis TaxID=1736690 RepID=A0ABU9XUZ2_9SPHN
MSAGFVGWLVEALVASTMLMALVLALRGPVRRAFGPDVAYALWALPVLRLLLPPLPAAWREIAVAPISAAGETITLYVVQPLGGSAAAAPIDGSLPLALIVTGLWAAGAAAFLIWHTTHHMRFCRRMLRHQIRGSEIEGGIHLIETKAASGPLAFGILRKYVAFPRDFVERYDQEERDLALAHEIGHHDRGDLIANWLALAVLALHWFNPIAWRAFRAFRADQEIANDARVLAGLGPVARHSYACAIVKSAHGGAVSAACHLHTIDDLKGRLRMLTTDRTSRSRLIGGGVAVAALTIVGLGLTASGTLAAETVRDRVEATTGVDLAALDVIPPAAPVPPAPPAIPAPISAAEVAELPEPPAPPAPPAPAVPSVHHGERRDVTTTRVTGDDGKTVTRIKVVVRDKNGAVRTDQWDEPADIAEISRGTCPGAASGKNMVVEDVKHGKRRLTICRDRIDAAVAHATAMATQGRVMAAHGRAMAAQARAMAFDERAIQRNALNAALVGLHAARAGIEANREMTATARRHALDGIAKGMAEVESEIAKPE